MKKVIAFFLILVLAGACLPVPCFAAAAEAPEYDEKMAAAFGLSGLEWTDDPQTNEEFFSQFPAGFPRRGMGLPRGFR